MGINDTNAYAMQSLLNQNKLENLFARFNKTLDKCSSLPTDEERLELESSYRELRQMLFDMTLFLNKWENEYHSDPQKPCGYCNGTGTIEKKRYKDIEQICPICQGKKRAEGKFCSACGGKGTISKKTRDIEGMIEYVDATCPDCQGVGLRYCDTCKGRGKIINNQVILEKATCTSCNGTGLKGVVNPNTAQGYQDLLKIVLHIQNYILSLKTYKMDIYNILISTRE
uniref:CR-type domain-containing protein n=1 Tax=Candidatus Methanomethylicus mesodigestus TaxID=1867258 RepID=A0A7C3F9V1_9CREN